MPMKIRISVLILISAFFFSCDEDITTLAPYEDVAIIWSFLDKSDTAHYVVIQKGFTNPNDDANDITQIADSLYFDNLDVSMQEISSNGSVNNTYTLELVNLVEEGYPKNSGNFTTSENYAYKFKATLDPNYSYKIIAKKDDKTFEAVTSILDVDASTLNVFGLEWRGNDSSNHLNFTNGSGDKQALYWSPTNGSTFDAYLNLKYFEIESSNPLDTIVRYVNWKVVDNEMPTTNASMSKSLYYDELKAELLQNIPAAGSNTSRYIGFLDFKMAAGSDRLINYLNLAQARQGISSGQVTPEFDEGFNTPYTYGLFDTRGSASYYKLTLSAGTMQLLMFDPSLADLQIKGQIRK